MKALCGILFSRPADLRDATGCLRASPHYAHPHLCRDVDGVEWEWETDMECNCEDCQSDEVDDWCITFWRVEDRRPKPKAKRIR